MKTLKRFTFLLSETLRTQTERGVELSLFDLADLLDISYLALSDIYFKRKKPSLEAMEYIFEKLSGLKLLESQDLEYQDLVEEVSNSLVIIRNIEDRSQWLAFAILELKYSGIADEKISNRLCVPEIRIFTIINELKTLCIA